VFKGKKMAGHMGSKYRTIQNLEIIRSDNENNLMFIKGSIPGSKNSVVLIKKISKNITRETILEKTNKIQKEIIKTSAKKESDKKSTQTKKTDPKEENKKAKQKNKEKK
jgi:large subunit ribosomal protein L3